MGGGEDAVRTSRHGHQRQGEPGRLLMLPSELLEHILTNVDEGSWPCLYRTCKQLREWVSAQAAAGWSSKVQTRLYLNCDFRWWDPVCHYVEDWQWLQHRHTPTYVMVQKPPAKPSDCIILPRSLEFSALIESGKVDADRLRSIANRSSLQIQLHVAAPQSPAYRAPPSPPIYVHSWLTFFLHQQQATPAVAACFSHITVIRLQNVRLLHPLPDCIGSVCTSLRKYSLQDVVWPEQLQAGKPWPQLQHLALSTASTAQLSLLVNLSTLPGLQGLYINGWPSLASVSPAVASAVSFSHQLTTLVLGSQDSLRAIIGWPKAKPAFPCVTRVEVQYRVGDDRFQSLLAAAPALQHLKLNTLQLSRSHASTQCKLQHLEVSAMPQYVTTLARLPRMPELKQFQLPNFIVKDQHIDATQVAAATAAVTTLHKVVWQVVLRLEGADAALLQHMQALGPLLQALQQKSAVVGIYCEGLNETKLQALGAAKVAHWTFYYCPSHSPGILKRLWTLMPDTHQVSWAPVYNPKQPSVAVDEALALCRSATRPVTVDVSWYTAEDKNQIRHALEAEGNKLVNLKCLW